MTTEPKKKGRPKGAKDKTPRKRRTKKEIEEAKRNNHGKINETV